MGLKLTAELGLDGTGFARGLSSAQHQAKEFGRTVADGLKGFVVGAVGIGTLEMAISKTVETATELVNASKQLGIGAEQIQVLRQAAKDAGSDLGTLEKAFEKIDEARERALSPGPDQMKALHAFGRMGVGPDQLKTMTAGQIFAGPLAGMAQKMNPEDLGPMLKALLQMKDIGPVVGILKTDLAELGAKMKDAGAIMDMETAVKLKHLGDEISIVSQIIASQLGPALLKMVEWLYTTTLKGGKALASVSSIPGAAMGTNRGVIQGLLDLAMMARTGATGIFMRESGLWSSQRAKRWMADQIINSGAGETADAIAKAGGQAEAPWQKKLDEFAARMEAMRKEAAGLENQKAPRFAPDFGKASAKNLETPSDSLTRVGNFLGGGGNALAKLAEQSNRYLQEIAHNTAQHGGNVHRTQSGMPIPGITMNGRFFPAG